jgi:hypothetical protein
VSMDVTVCISLTVMGNSMRILLVTVDFSCDMLDYSNAWMYNSDTEHMQCMCYQSVAGGVFNALNFHHCDNICGLSPN